MIIIIIWCTAVDTYHAEKFHVAAQRGRLKHYHARAHTDRSCGSFNQQTRVATLLARELPREDAYNGSPPSIKYNIDSQIQIFFRHWATKRKPTFRSNFWNDERSLPWQLDLVRTWWISKFSSLTTSSFHVYRSNWEISTIRFNFCSLKRLL